MRKQNMKNNNKDALFYLTCVVTLLVFVWHPVCWQYLENVQYYLWLLQQNIQQRNKLITCGCTRKFSISRGLLLWGLPILFTILLAFFAVSFRLFDLVVGPSTSPLVDLPPGVQSRRSPVHGPLHKAKVGLAALTRPVTLPPVLPVHINLIVETVVHLTRGQRKQSFGRLFYYSNLCKRLCDNIS